jgi:hypothetical protein
MTRGLELYRHLGTGHKFMELSSLFVRTLEGAGFHSWLPHTPRTSNAHQTSARSNQPSIGLLCDVKIAERVS